MKKIFFLVLIIIGISCVSFINVNSSKAVGQCGIDSKAQRSGCCSRHGGVCGCNKTINKLKCCDGTSSPSCGC